MDMVANVVLPDGRELWWRGALWFEAVLRQVLREEYGRLVEQLPLCPPGEWDEPHGPGHGVWAQVSVTARPWTGIDTVEYSAASWEWLKQELAGHPLYASLTVTRLDADGGLDEGAQGRLRAEIRTDEDRPEWALFEIVSDLEQCASQVSNDEAARRYAEAVCGSRHNRGGDHGHGNDK